MCVHVFVQRKSISYIIHLNIHQVEYLYFFTNIYIHKSSKETNPGLPFIGVEAPDYGVDSCRLGRLISFLSKKKKIQ